MDDARGRQGIAENYKECPAGTDAGQRARGQRAGGQRAGRRQYKGATLHVTSLRLGTAPTCAQQPTPLASPGKDDKEQSSAV